MHSKGLVVRSCRIGARACDRTGPGYLPAPRTVASFLREAEHARQPLFLRVSRQSLGCMEVSDGCGVYALRGLDVHKKSITACRMVPDPTGQEAEGITELRTFGTMTRDLLVLADWLTEASITHVAMESTGEYWKPVYNLLEGTFTVFLVNATHVKNVPGRKTDKSRCPLARQTDALWLTASEFHPAQGATRPCVISPATGRSSCKSGSVRSIGSKGCWKRANIKLASVIADIMGCLGPSHDGGAHCWAADPATMAALANDACAQRFL